MKSVGIICECNPFHGGHAHLINRARESGADAVICVMSGYFVQRGEAAILDAHTRAKAIVCGGADAVLELPFPYSAAGAEFFALAGVRMLDRLGVDELWFGSECGDLAMLTRAAEICDSAEFCERYAEQSDAVSGTAESYFTLLRAYMGEDVTCLSNDILGIAYLRALKKIGSGITPVTLRREGSAYTETVMREGGYPSATALRRTWRAEGIGSVLPHLPESVRDVYAGARELADLRYAERAVLAHFRLTPVDALEQIEALSGGLGARMAKAAQSATTLKELLTFSATKKYPTARLQRGILFAMTGILHKDVCAEPAYARLLAASETGCAFLAAHRKMGDFPIVTRRTDLPNTPEAKRQAEMEERAYALYTLCLQKTTAVETLWKRTAYIQK